MWVFFLQNASPFLSIGYLRLHFFLFFKFFLCRWKDRLTDGFFFHSIGWHTAEGFALQFVERYDEIAGLYNSTELEDSCEAWSTFQTSAGILQDDDGI